MPNQYTPMTSTAALESLDVHPALLSAEESGLLDAKGYLLLEDILTQDEVAYLRHRLDELAASEGDSAGSELHREEGTVRLANLLDIAFEPIACTGASFLTTFIAKALAPYVFILFPLGGNVRRVVSTTYTVYQTQITRKTNQRIKIKLIWV